MEEIKLIVKDGYAFNYNDNKCTGSIANIYLGKTLEVIVTKVGSRYHCQCTISGVLIQMWCTEYNIEKITY